MPPLPPSSPTSTRGQTTSRQPNAARASTAASQARAGAGTLRGQQGGSSNGSGTGANRSTRISTSSGKDGDATRSRAGARRSSINVNGIEKRPSKDGTAQRRAKEVEGLKNFVRPFNVAFRLEHVLTLTSNSVIALAAEPLAASIVP